MALGTGLRKWIAPAALALALAGCQDKPVPAGYESVRIGSDRFLLELAADNAKRVKGLGGRNEIAADGGMLFVFPAPMPLAFVMRDCPIAIDVAFLDGAGRVLTVHEMKPEPARQPGESAESYEQRLPRYESRFPAQFAIETRGGRLKEVGLKEGDRPGLDVERLKKLVK
jgi:uncharacterized membrane protein (UPF0127 family)